MNGDWPSEWEDLDEFPEGGDQLDAEAEGRLSDVTAYLASLPAPVLPDAVEARISAALAAEAAAWTGASEGDDVLPPAGHAARGAAEPADGARVLEPAPARTRVRRHQSGGRVRRALRSRPLLKVGSAVAACLVVAGLGYGLSRGGGPSGMSSASSAAGSPARDQAGPDLGQAASAPEPAASAASSAGSSARVSMSLAVVESGTKYHAATLAVQARANVAPAESAPNSNGNRTSQADTPTAALRGCVAHLTGGQSPRLVDRATYQGKPAYIIVGSADVWVVGLGCTAGNPELIASVPLGP